MGGLLAVLPIASGIDAAAFLPAGTDDVSIARAALAAGIETHPLSAYVVETAAPSGLVLGFAPFDRPQIKAGIDTLAQVLEAAPRLRPHGDPRRRGTG